MHWFTADPHYSHGNIIRFCERPFPEVAAMNAHLLAECRARVGPDDVLWILGDFTAGRTTDAQRLPEDLHVCPECIGGYLSVGEVTLPAGFTFDETWNRAVPREK